MRHVQILGAVALLCAASAHGQDAAPQPETGSGAAASAPAPYPIGHWALRAVVRNVGVSPSGKHLSLLRLPSKEGNPIIEIFDTADLSQEPFRLNAEPMEITGAFWVSDRHLLFNLRQKVRNKIDGFNRGVYETKFAILDVETKKMRQFDANRTGIVNILRNKPNKVIVASAGASSGPAARVHPGFRPRDYYELDLRKGSRKLLVRGSPTYGAVTFDADGRPRISFGVDTATRELVYYWRPPGESGWKEFYRLHVDESEFDNFSPVAIDPNQENHAWVVARNGKNTYGLWLYDLAAKRFVEAIYQRSDVDVSGVMDHSNAWQHPDIPVGVVYHTDKRHVEYFDEVEGATLAQLEAITPMADAVSIVSRSRDGGTLVFHNEGPRDPGTYYLFRNGRVQVVGREQPLLDSEHLAEVDFVAFKARDGLRIPAYITLPHGEPPFPTVVLPHGGPFSRDLPGYDWWAQMLANNGYAVIQPQFRGSTGFGVKLHRAAFEGDGQQGYKMQDDKDDAAFYMVERGLADPDRLAMFGWSYGGYAALVAASRTPQIYRCVIAGAPVTDPVMQINYYRYSLPEGIRDRHVRKDETGIRPVRESDKVNVPLLLIHGEVDQRVPIDHARKYLARLEESDKPYQFVELKGADHFLGSLFYEHRLETSEQMIRFLANDCGPGGL